MTNGKITPIRNFESILVMKNDILWIKKAMYGVFGAIVLNIIINLIVLQ